MSAAREVHIDGDEGQYAGRIRLRLSDFNRQNIVTPGQVVRAVEILPDFHLEGLVAVRYDPSRTNTTFRGLYVGLVRGVVVAKFESRDAFYAALYHEIGHYVYDRILDGTVKTRWVNQLFPGARCVSDWAARNACEDFAESYRFYVLDPARLEPLAAKFAYMRDDVFRGFTPDLTRLG